MVSGLTVRYLIHFELVVVCGVRCVHAKSLQLCPTLYHSMDHSLPGSSIHGILQTRILEWFAIFFPKDRPSPGVEPASLISCSGRQLLTTSATWDSGTVAFFYIWLSSFLSVFY